MLKTFVLVFVSAGMGASAVFLGMRHQPALAPQLPRYRFEHAGPESFLVRIDERTGETEELFGSTWKKCDHEPDASKPAGTVFDDIARGQQTAPANSPSRPELVDDATKEGPNWQKSAAEEVTKLTQSGVVLTDEDVVNIIDAHKQASLTNGLRPIPYELTHQLQVKNPVGNP